MIEYFEKPLWEWINSAPEGSQRETSLILTKERLVIRFTQQACDEKGMVFQHYLNFSWRDLRRELEISKQKPPSIIQYYIKQKTLEIDARWKEYQESKNENRPL